MKAKWNKEKDDFLKREYLNYKSQELAEALGVTLGSVCYRLRYLGLNKNKDKENREKYCKKCGTLITDDIAKVNYNKDRTKSYVCNTCTNCLNIEKKLQRRGIDKQIKSYEERLNKKLNEIYICKECNESKPGSEFSISTRDLCRNTICKECIRKKNEETIKQSILENKIW